ncbi:MAG TPA: hypothetical protein GX699_00295 [Firmicutes bacterium]|nr:hypothetical protein [Bacillota bacterium]
MVVFKLLCTSLLLACGMLLLPPVNGDGPGSMAARIWLGFGLLVFYSHWLQDGMNRGEKKRQQPAFKAHPQHGQVQGHNAERRVYAGQ